MSDVVDIVSSSIDNGAAPNMPGPLLYVDPPNAIDTISGMDNYDETNATDPLSGETSSDRQDLSKASINAKKHFCPMCDFGTAHRRQLERHLAEVHLNIRPFECGLCDYAGKRQEQLRDHLRHHVIFQPLVVVHRDSLHPAETEVRHTQSMSCGKCHFETSDQSELWEHVMKLHSAKLNTDTMRKAIKNVRLSVQSLRRNPVICDSFSCDQSSQEAVLVHEELDISDDEIRLDDEEHNPLEHLEQNMLEEIELQPLELNTIGHLEHTHSKQQADTASEHSEHGSFDLLEENSLEIVENTPGHFELDTTEQSEKTQPEHSEENDNYSESSEHVGREAISDEDNFGPSIDAVVSVKPEPVEVEVDMDHFDLEEDEEEEALEDVEQDEEDEEEALDDDEDDLSCPECDFGAESASELRTHVSSIHGKRRPKSFGCDASAADLREAEVSVPDLVDFVQGVSVEGAAGLKNFHVCSQCGYSTTVKQNLFKHVRAVHLKIRTPKNYSCERCPFKAEYRSLIKHHMETVHDGVREFACTFCDYKAKRGEHLRGHIERRHPDGTAAKSKSASAKKFSCEQCDYKAARSTHLRGHIERRHSEQTGDRKRNDRFYY